MQKQKQKQTSYLYKKATLIIQLKKRSKIRSYLGASLVHILVFARATSIGHIG
jgi:hypothetical protein